MWRWVLADRNCLMDVDCVFMWLLKVWCCWGRNHVVRSLPTTFEWALYLPPLGGDPNAHKRLMNPDMIEHLWYMLQEEKEKECYLLLWLICDQDWCDSFRMQTWKRLWLSTLGRLRLSIGSWMSWWKESWHWRTFWTTPPLGSMRTSIGLELLKEWCGGIWFITRQRSGRSMTDASVAWRGSHPWSMWRLQEPVGELVQFWTIMFLSRQSKLSWYVCDIALIWQELITCVVDLNPYQGVYSSRHSCSYCEWSEGQAFFSKY